MRAPACLRSPHGQDVAPSFEPRFELSYEPISNPEPIPEPDPSQVLSQVPSQKPGTSAELSDLRFRALMTDKDWASLPLSIRQRSAGASPGDARRLLRRDTGLLDEPCRMVARPAARPIGGPCRLRAALMPPTSEHPSSIVTLTERIGGHIWTRLSCAPQRLPAGHPFLQAFRRSDRPGRICRLRRRHRAHGHAREGALIFRSENISS